MRATGEPDSIWHQPICAVHLLPNAVTAVQKANDMCSTMNWLGADVTSGTVSKCSPLPHFLSLNPLEKGILWVSLWLHPQWESWMESHKQTRSRLRAPGHGPSDVLLKWFQYERKIQSTAAVSGEIARLICVSISVSFVTCVLSTQQQVKLQTDTHSQSKQLASKRSKCRDKQQEFLRRNSWTDSSEYFYINIAGDTVIPSAMSAFKEALSSLSLESVKSARTSPVCWCSSTCFHSGIHSSTTNFHDNYLLPSKHFLTTQWCHSPQFTPSSFWYRERNLTFQTQPCPYFCYAVETHTKVCAALRGAEVKAWLWNGGLISNVCFGAARLLRAKCQGGKDLLWCWLTSDVAQRQRKALPNYSKENKFIVLVF